MDSKNIKIKRIEDSFVKLLWEFKCDYKDSFIWSDIKDTPLLNDEHKPIGLLKDFRVINENEFKVSLEFIVWKRLFSELFTDIEMNIKNGKFEFKIK